VRLYPGQRLRRQPADHASDTINPHRLDEPLSFDGSLVDAPYDVHAIGHAPEYRESLAVQISVPPKVE
jgi:hypothetical protein